MTKADTLRGRFEERAAKDLGVWFNNEVRLDDCPREVIFRALVSKYAAQPTEAEIDELAREIVDEWVREDLEEIALPRVASLLRGKLGGTTK